MNYVVVDLDMTLVDTRQIIKLAGPEPKRASSKEHQAWVKLVTDSDTLRKADIIKTTEHLVRHLSAPGYFTTTVFMTSRSEDLRDVTRAWLMQHGLHGELYMRPAGNLQPSGILKSGIVLSKLQPRDIDTVTFIDDDPDGSLEKECKKKGWTHLKVTSY